MAVNNDKFLYEKISTSERLKLHFFAVIHALTFLIKQVARRFWKIRKTKSEKCHKPPSCLVDNTLGCHWYIKIQSLKLHYVEAGNENLPLVILLHGFPDCWFGWRHQINFLSKHFRVVAVDLKGFGDSDKPVSRLNYNIKTLMNELFCLIISFQSSKNIIIGHDLGAYLGWYFATAYPDCISQLVAISCPHPNVFWDYLSPKSRLNARWIQFCQMPLLPELEVADRNMSIIDEFYTHLRLKKEENLIEAYKYAFSRPEDWTGPLNYYRNLPFYRINKNHCKMTVPVLLIVGNSDPHVSLESIITSTEFISTYTMKVVKGAAHYPHQENSDHVNNLLLQFLKVPQKETEPTTYRKTLMNTLCVKTKKYKIPW